MNTDVEGLLREGMERFTKDLRAPAGLTRLAARRRRRRLAVRSATAVAAALTAGAASVMAVVVSGPHGGIGTTAYVVKRVSNALSAAGPEIAQMKVTTHGLAMPGGSVVPLTTEEWSYGDQWRWLTDSPSGHPVFDEGFSSSAVYTLVNYQSRTWARQQEQRVPPKGTPYPVPGPSGCELVVDALTSMFRPGLPGPGVPASSLPTTAARALRTAVSCGTLTVAGRERVDGVEAIKLTSGPGSQLSETIWVSPGTYLPVRATIRPAAGFKVPWLTADITWLPATAQNLAKLAVSIPAGFRQVQFVQAAAPAGQQNRGPRWPGFRLCLAPDGPGCENEPVFSGSVLPRAGPEVTAGPRGTPANDDQRLARTGRGGEI
jgi:hypothetical protein